MAKTPTTPTPPKPNTSPDPLNPFNYSLPGIVINGGKVPNPLAPNNNPGSSNSVLPGLPFGIGNLPIFRKGFWVRAGVLFLGVLFIWWAVLIFVAQTKAGKTLIKAGETAIAPEATIGSAVAGTLAS